VRDEKWQSDTSSKVDEIYRMLEEFRETTLDFDHDSEELSLIEHLIKHQRRSENKIQWLYSIVKALVLREPRNFEAAAPVLSMNNEYPVERTNTWHSEWLAAVFDKEFNASGIRPELTKIEEVVSSLVEQNASAGWVRTPQTFVMNSLLLTPWTMSFSSQGVEHLGNAMNEYLTSVTNVSTVLWQEGDGPQQWSIGTAWYAYENAFESGGSERKLTFKYNAMHEGVHRGSLIVPTDVAAGPVGIGTFTPVAINAAGNMPELSTKISFPNQDERCTYAFENTAWNVTVSYDLGNMTETSTPGTYLVRPITFVKAGTVVVGFEVPIVLTVPVASPKPKIGWTTDNSIGKPLSSMGFMDQGGFELVVGKSGRGSTITDRTKFRQLKSAIVTDDLNLILTGTFNWDELEPPADIQSVDALSKVDLGFLSLEERLARVETHVADMEQVQIDILNSINNDQSSWDVVLELAETAAGVAMNAGMMGGGASANLMRFGAVLSSITGGVESVQSMKRGQMLKASEDMMRAMSVLGLARSGSNHTEGSENEMSIFRLGEHRILESHYNATKANVEAVARGQRSGMPTVEYKTAHLTLSSGIERTIGNAVSKVYERFGGKYAVGHPTVSHQPMHAYVKVTYPLVEGGFFDGEPVAPGDVGKSIVYIMEHNDVIAGHLSPDQRNAGVTGHRGLTVEDWIKLNNPDLTAAQRQELRVKIEGSKDIIPHYHKYVVSAEGEVLPDSRNVLATAFDASTEVGIKDAARASDVFANEAGIRKDKPGYPLSVTTTGVQPTTIEAMMNEYQATSEEYDLWSWNCQHFGVEAYDFMKDGKLPQWWKQESIDSFKRDTKLRNAEAALDKHSAAAGMAPEKVDAARALINEMKERLSLPNFGLVPGGSRGDLPIDFDMSRWAN
jgi:hypothetical protein